mgnify:FL=1
MSEFFQHYPQIDYNITGTAPPKFKTAINIMTRAKLRNVIMNDVVQYFPYSIPEAERPDNTSFKIYGDVKYTWLIFLINDIHDPIYDWPLGSREFVTFIKSKYGSITVAKNNIHHYEQILRDRVEATGTMDAIPQAKIEVDLTTYNALGSGEKDVVYSFNWEVDRNEAKRDIKLVDPIYAGSIFAELSEKLQ